ncbi:MAG: hypothetical protein ACON4I_01355 [Candidatus Puniceispirillaceae bacterium]
MTLEWALDILQIVFADIILSGDNALVIGMAAAGLAPEFRRRHVFRGWKVWMPTHARETHACANIFRARILPETDRNQVKRT